MIKRGNSFFFNLESSLQLTYVFLFKENPFFGKENIFYRKL
jgi:hypothetical protein